MLAIDGVLLAALIPVILAVAIGIASRSLLMSVIGALLSLSFIGSKIANDFITSSFLLVAFFASMGAAVFMARTVLGTSD